MIKDAVVRKGVFAGMPPAPPSGSSATLPKLAVQVFGSIPMRSFTADEIRWVRPAFPVSFSDADQKCLTEQITATVNNEVFPAYKKFATFIRRTTFHKLEQRSRSTPLVGASAATKLRCAASLQLI
jgi:hypothetical protein